MANDKDKGTGKSKSKQSTPNAQRVKKKPQTFKLFGYGSLNVPMIESLVGHKLHKEPAPAFIKNHVRIFTGYSEYWKGAVASLHPLQGKRVYGCIVHVTKEDLKHLDEYEGTDNEEEGYTRVLRAIHAMTIDKDGTHTTKTMCYVYIRNKHVFESLPSIRYINSIRVNLNAVKLADKDPIEIFAAVDDNGGKARIMKIVDLHSHSSKH